MYQWDEDDRMNGLKKKVFDDKMNKWADEVKKMNKVFDNKMNEWADEDITRAPELLFGTKQYGSGVDVWAAACIFVELLLRRPFLQGSSDIDQLGKIFTAFGTPKSSQWPGMIYLPDYVEYQFVPAPPLHSLFPVASDDALDLLSKLFAYDPKVRISVRQALEHRYFSSLPAPTKPALLPRPASKGESRPTDFNPHGGPIVLSPPRKSRRVMVQREGLDGNTYQFDKVDDHANEATDRISGRSGTMPISIDWSMFGSRPPPRPTLNRTHLKRKLDLEFPTF
ncbi:hypothetical protein NE237_006918 [Protea cynaroides]|uniref:[RNA-polymerase]-subunit kinase n=1 Tax=Protea cynaroides TaxID=273540 RepID=A0A9Q0KNI6_9MAGN|nr:hypothetical protein NE237_006918 [Protea cynaroides]